MYTISSILSNMPEISKPTREFFHDLFQSVMSAGRRVNFRNLARYSDYCERTFRRQFNKPFPFLRLNQLLIENSIEMKKPVIATDCTFSPKSGKHTFGLGRFYNGSAGRQERGLEFSTLALVDADEEKKKSGKALTLSVWQTSEKSSSLHESKIDLFLEQIRQSADFLKEKTNIVVADGFYAKQSFMNGLQNMGFVLVTKLRKDAFLCEEPPAPTGKRGRPKKYGDKIEINSESSYTFIKNIEPKGVENLLPLKESEQVKMYTKDVYAPNFGRKLRVVALFQNGKLLALLASTDLSLSSEDILLYYQARFQIEFSYRDAKQYFGFSHFQTLKAQRIDFHVNMSMMFTNLAYVELWNEKHCSVSDYKMKQKNMKFCDFIFQHLDLDLNALKIHPSYPNIINWGTIAA